MDWEAVYRSRLMSADEAVRQCVKDQDVIYIGGLMISVFTLETMFRQIREGKLNGITMVGNLILNPLPFEDPIFSSERLSYKSFFWGNIERAGSKSGNVSHVPLQLHDLHRYIATKAKPNVAIVNATPPDEAGNCNIGPFSSGFGPAGIDTAGKIIVQINHNLPRVCGQNLNIHVSRVAAFVEHDEGLVEYPMAASTEIDQAIANHIIDRIPDGACIQLGLGGIANAVGYGLKDKKDLGVHSEMLTESMVYLHKLGVINNSKKNFMPGKLVVGFTLGSQAQYDYVHNNPAMYFAPYHFTNAVANIMKNENMISINSALAVDLTGQVGSESIGFSQFSGTGGQVDFIRGASAAAGGKSFLTLPSTYSSAGNKKSRIVLNFPPGGCVTSLRTDVHYIVTEYGCADLFGEDIPTRARRLIGIAHPEFRDELWFEAKKNRLIS